MQSNNLCNVIVIPMMDDNFCYYIHRQDNIQNGVFIDVAEEEVAYEFLREFGITSMTNVYTTHKHFDHSDGNLPCQAKFPGMKVWGGQFDNIPGCTNPVKDNMEWEAMGGVKVKGFHTPCHT